MSRSIHQGQRALRDAYDEDRAEGLARTAQAAFLDVAEQTTTKGRIKRLVRRERSSPVDHAALPANDVQIQAEDLPAEWIHAASADDVRAILERVPMKYRAGLAAVELRRLRDLEIGMREIPVSESFLEMWPGVFVPERRGTYDRVLRTVLLYATRVQGPLPAWARCAARWKALDTFMHELAHHHDAVARVARGRWRWDEVQAEAYAEKQQKALRRAFVVPYLIEVWPDEWDAIGEWHDSPEGKAWNPRSG
jgi:hypothetical protein